MAFLKNHQIIIYIDREPRILNLKIEVTKG